MCIPVAVRTCIVAVHACCHSMSALSGGRGGGAAANVSADSTQLNSTHLTFHRDKHVLHQRGSNPSLRPRTQADRQADSQTDSIRVCTSSISRAFSLSPSRCSISAHAWHTNGFPGSTLKPLAKLTRAVAGSPNWFMIESGGRMTTGNHQETGCCAFLAVYLVCVFFFLFSSHVLYQIVFLFTYFSEFLYFCS